MADWLIVARLGKDTADGWGPWADRCLGWVSDPDVRRLMRPLFSLTGDVSGITPSYVQYVVDMHGRVKC